MSDRSTDQQHLVTASFRDREAAERAYDDLVSRGYKPNEIHVLMSDDTRKRHFIKSKETTELGNKAMKGAGVGGTVGGIVGATAVGLAAAAATVTVPVLGLVIAGPLAGALAGGAGGAAAGGLLGMLVGAGIPEQRAKLYQFRRTPTRFTRAIAGGNDRGQVLIDSLRHRVLHLVDRRRPLRGFLGDHRAKRLGVVAVQRAHRLDEDEDVTVVVVHVSRYPMPRSECRSFIIPPRIHVFTVPSGLSSFAAMSL